MPTRECRTQNMATAAMTRSSQQLRRVVRFLHQIVGSVGEPQPSLPMNGVRQQLCLSATNGSAIHTGEARVQVEKDAPR